MSELAYNANGEAFEVPASVTGWRVRRMKPRGAPELVYGEDGRPLVLPIETTIDDLRDAVGTAGKYRLDPVNDDGKCVEAVPPAYVQVTRQVRNVDAPLSALSAPSAASDDTLREAMRMNTELARTVIDKFSYVMEASAGLLAAADGAGISRREPRVTRDEDDVDDDDDADTDAPAPASSPMLELANTLVEKLVPLVMSAIASKGMPSFAEMLDWRKGGPRPSSDAPKAIPHATSAANENTGSASTAKESEAALPPLGPQQMAHFLAIQSALTPAEAALARQLGAELSPTDMRAWLADLSDRSVPDAVAKIRTLLGGRKAGGVS